MTDRIFGETSWRIASFAIGFLLMTAYWPDVAGAATTPRWMVGALISLLMLVPASSRRWTNVHSTGAFLFAWLALSLLWTSSRPDGTDDLFKLGVTAAAFVVGRRIENPKALVIGAAFGMAVESLIVIAQFRGYVGIPSYSLPGALFYNGNRLAEAAALVFIAVCALRLWWMVPLLLPSLMMPHGRAAMLAAAMGLIALMCPKDRRLSWLVILGPLAGAFALMWWRQDVDISARDRLAMWSDTWNALNVLGHGLGSFGEDSFHFVKAYNLTHGRLEYPHNEFLWLAYEGGIIAFALVGLLAVRLWRASDDPLRLVLLGLLVIGCFAMPLHDPASVLFAALCAGHLVRRSDRARSENGARRLPLRARMA